MGHLGLVGLLLAGLLLALGALVVWMMLVVARPPRRTYASALAAGRPGDPSRLPPGPAGPRTYEQWSLRVGSMELPVWDMPGDAAHGPILVLTHGWGDSRVGALPRAHALLPYASRVIMWDMPGHGEAPGWCALGVREPALLRALIDRVASDTTPIVLMGWSLGAGVSIAAAAQEQDDRRVAAVIAEAPYRSPRTPAAGVLRRMGMPAGPLLGAALTLLGVRLGQGWRFAGDARDFDRAVRAAGLKAPLLVLHGASDDICPIIDGEAIAHAAPRGTLVRIDGGGHQGLWTDPTHSAMCAAAAADVLRRAAPTRAAGKAS